MQDIYSSFFFNSKSQQTVVIRPTALINVLLSHFDIKQAFITFFSAKQIRRLVKHFQVSHCSFLCKAKVTITFKIDKI